MNGLLTYVFMFTTIVLLPNLTCKKIYFVLLFCYTMVTSYIAREDLNIGLKAYALNTYKPMKFAQHC